MKKRQIRKKLLPTLLITLYTVPGVVSAETPAVKNAQPVPGAAPRKNAESRAVRQEVIQFVRQGDSDRVTVNIAGQPGTHFRLLYSLTGKDKSYKTVPNSEGVIGENGMASFSFEPKKLGKEELYLRMVASDRADFSDSRITPKPVVLEVERLQVKERGMRDGKTLAPEIDRGRVTALAGVRG